MKCQSFSLQNNFDDTSQFSEDIMEIYIFFSKFFYTYIEKFTKIGTSELR